MEKDIRSTRRFYHTIAEPGFLEFRTTINIIKNLKEIGVDEIRFGKEIHSPAYMYGRPSPKQTKSYASTIDEEVDFDIREILEGYTGAVAKIYTNKPGPNIGFRFDIDALTIRESKEEAHRPAKEGFRSKNDKTCHACGHDGHLSIGLFLGKWLVENKEKLRGTYTLIFQPAEEGLRGARSLTEAGVADNLDYLFAGHLGMGVEDGKICVGTGGFLSSTKIDIIFKGHAAHAGALPEEGKNANLAAATATLNLHTITQFSTGTARVNVGVIRGGSTRNSVSDRAVLEMETRGETEAINQTLVKRTYDIVEGAAKAFDLAYEIKTVGSAPALLKIESEFYKEINDMLGKRGYKTFLNGKFKASEDVVYFINKVEENGGKAVHFIFGSKLAAGHHKDSFDFNEDTLDEALGVFKEVIRYLN